MAHISTQKTKEIREALKTKYPEIKFSVRKSSGSIALDVTIVKSPYDFLRNISDEVHGRGYMQVNHYWVETSRLEHQDILKDIIDICNTGNWNNSDAMTDYFDVGWYLHLNIGTWDRPYELTTSSKSQRRVA